MRLLVDMNLSPTWVSHFREAGFEAVHWSAVGAADATDRTLMQWAATRDYVVITCDLDFSAILAATGGGKPSVVQIRSGQLSPKTIGDAVVHAITAMHHELDKGALILFEPDRIRVRILPLGE